MILLFLIFLSQECLNMPAVFHRMGALVERCSFQSSWILTVCQYVTGIFKVSLLKLLLDWKRGNYFPSMLPGTAHLSIVLKLCLFCGLILKLLYWAELVSIFSWTERKSEINVMVRFISRDWRWDLFWRTEM